MKGPRTLLFSMIKYLYPAVRTFDLTTQPAPERGVKMGRTLYRPAHASITVSAGSARVYERLPKVPLREAVHCLSKVLRQQRDTDDGLQVTKKLRLRAKPLPVVAVVGMLQEAHVFRYFQLLNIVVLDAN